MDLALKATTRNARKTLLKPPEGFQKYQWVLWNRLHRSDQSNEVSSTKEQLSMKKKRICEAKIKASTENATPKPIGYQQVP